MPASTGRDSRGCFARWGSQKKYYFPCGDNKARSKAISKAKRQAQAIYASGYKG